MTVIWRLFLCQTLCQMCWNFGIAISAPDSKILRVHSQKSQVSGPADQSCTRTLLLALVICVLWIVWQSIGIEAMRPPWEDDIMYTLPAVNWATDGRLFLPQLGHFMDADVAWRWHMPLFPVLLAAWVKLTGYQLLAIRMFGLLSGAGTAFLLARCCTRLAGQHLTPWLLFWLAIILGDKSFVVYSLTGRMEFCCLLAAIGSIELVLNSRRPLALTTSGVLMGMAAGFHPLAVYLFPGLIWLATTRGRPDSGGIRFEWKPAFPVALGFGTAVLGIVLWFLSDWPTTQAQFPHMVQGSAAGSLAQNVRDLIFGLARNFRFQPVFPFVVFAAIAIHAWQIPRRKPGAGDKALSVGLLLLLFGLVGFLLRGSSGHLNYYPSLVLAALLLLAASLPILGSISARAHKIGLFVIALVLLNNLVFVGAKTRTVWRNRDLLDPGPMNAFLDAQTRGVSRCVIPANLWLYGKQHDLNFRIGFLDIKGQPETTYRAYSQSLLDWQPQLVILDTGDMASHPGNHLTPDQLTAAGYVEQARFNRVFRERFSYDGYRLVCYRRADTAADPAK
jgi:hypothetical protein